MTQQDINTKHCGCGFDGMESGIEGFIGMNERNSFILYTDIIEVVSALSTEQKGILFQAILDYQTSGVATIDDDIVKIAFIPIRQRLDANNAKWQDKAESRKEAGRRGGLAKGSKNDFAKNEIAKDSKTDFAKNEIANPSKNNFAKNDDEKNSKTNFATKKIANEAVNVNVNVNGNGNVNVNDKIPPSPLGGGIEPKTLASADNLAWFDLHASEVNRSPQLAKKARNWLLSIGDKHRRLAEIDVVDFLELLEQKERQFGTEAVLDRISRDMSAGYKNIMWDKLTTVEPVSADKQGEPPPEETPQEESPGWSEERWDAYYSRLDKKYRVDAEKLGMTLDEYYCSDSYAQDEKRDQAEADKMGMHLDEYFDYLDGKSRDSPNDSSGVREGGME